MRKLLEFIRSVYVTVLFILLEILALGYYARSTVYTEARLLAQTNRLFGGVNGTINDIGNFFALGRENRTLTDRIAQLEERLALYQEMEQLSAQVTEIANNDMSKYKMQTASIVGSTIAHPRNYITLNRGQEDGVRHGMAVTTPEGAIVGHVIACSDHYAVAISILNMEFRASGCIEGNSYYGAIRWDGRNPNYVWMQDLSKYAEPQPGDRVVTSGLEPYFPQGMLIGTVEEATLTELGTTYNVRVRLAADLSRLSNLILIENIDLYEIELLQEQALGSTNN